MPPRPDEFKKKQGKRQLGLYKGQIWMAEDFDAPMELIESSKLRTLEAEASSYRKKTATRSKATTKKTKKKSGRG